MDDLTPTPESQAGQADSDQTPVGSSTAGAPLTLSDGRSAVVRRGKGRDLLEASRRAGTDASRTQFELLCALTTLDGQPMQFEDFLEMPLADVTELMVRFGGNADFFPSNAATSSTSPR